MGSGIRRGAAHESRLVFEIPSGLRNAETKHPILRNLRLFPERIVIHNAGNRNGPPFLPGEGLFQKAFVKPVPELAVLPGNFCIF